MSGIYIPGLRVPEENEDELWIAVRSDGTVTFNAEWGWTMNNSKAVSVPPHGRLGDLDDVINDVRHYLCDGCGDYLGPDAKTESCDYCRGTMLIKTIERKSSIILADKEGE